LPNHGDRKIKENILTDLKKPSKMISCIYFYDEAGSKLFEAITRLPEYYLTRTEIPLIKKAAYALSDNLKNVDIVEFGSGDCTKISILLDAVPKKFRDTVRYMPFDISNAAVKKSSNILLIKYPGIRIHGIVADFMSQLDIIPKKSKKIFCFLGSTIGNISIDKAKLFLKNLGQIMNVGDMLLLGFDMVKNKEIIEKAYNDKNNLTEKFNKNILKVVNSHIKSDFNPDNFEHIAFYNEELSTIEMHLKATTDLNINCPGLKTNIFIGKGETIHTENSYKFTEEDINTLADAAKLGIQNIFTDENKWFSLVQLTKK
jgi:L-histidine N-alpha-methyltransferase